MHDCLASVALEESSFSLHHDFSNIETQIEDKRPQSMTWNRDVIKIKSETK